MTRSLIPNIFDIRYWRKTAAELTLVWHLLRDPDVAWWLKLLPLLMALYLLSPFDIIPGFLPVIGQLDDLGLMLLGLNVIARLAPEEVVARYRPQPAAE